MSTPGRSPRRSRTSAATASAWQTCPLVCVENTGSEPAGRRQLREEQHARVEPAPAARELVGLRSAMGNRLRIAGPSEKSMKAAAARLNHPVSKSRIEDGA